MVESENLIIKNNINVYDAINAIEDEGEDEICLITGDKLSEYNVKLSCGHTFNYIPLFNEVAQQKKSFYSKSQSYHMSTERLKIFQIKCPYCRGIQNNIMPYIPSIEKEKLNGVNYPFKYCMYLNKCEYLYKSGKHKNQSCGRSCNEKMCRIHSRKTNGLITTKNMKCEECNCKALIKSGQNKGMLCTNKAKHGEYCGRHKKEAKI